MTQIIGIFTKFIIFVCNGKRTIFGHSNGSFTVTKVY